MLRPVARTEIYAHLVSKSLSNVFISHIRYPNSLTGRPWCTSSYHTGTSTPCVVTDSSVCSEYLQSWSIGSRYISKRPATGNKTRIRHGVSRRLARCRSLTGAKRSTQGNRQKIMVRWCWFLDLEEYLSSYDWRCGLITEIQIMTRMLVEWSSLYYSCNSTPIPVCCTDPQRSTSIILGVSCRAFRTDIRRKSVASIGIRFRF